MGLQYYLRHGVPQLARKGIGYKRFAEAWGTVYYFLGMGITLPTRHGVRSTNQQKGMGYRVLVSGMGYSS